MKNILIVGLIVIGIGAGFAGGYYIRGYRTQATGDRTQEKTQVFVAPSPSPDPKTTNFNSDKVTVKSFDGKKLVYTLENKTEKTIADVSNIKVWLPPKVQGEKATETDWKAVKAGTTIVVASEKTTGRVTGVLVL